MDKYFLFIVGLMYVGLGLWCSIDPVSTAEVVGFSLIGGHGQSEFLTVYGGWEVAIGIVFMFPMFRSDWLPYSLMVCLIMHGCLVVFRTAGFFVFDVDHQSTYNLAIGEWVIFLCCKAMYLISKMNKARANEKYV